jgi:hypothetical protein
MASNRNIVRQEEIELIPSSQMPGFNESIATMQKYVADLTPIFNEAQKLNVTDRASRERAGELIAQIKRIDKDGEEEMKPHKKVIKSVTDFIQTHCRRVSNRAEEIRGILTKKMADWDRAEERAAAAERDRIAREKQAELDRLAEQKRQDDEKAAKELKDRRIREINADFKAGKIGAREKARLLKEAGAKEEALLAQAAADEAEAKTDAKMQAATTEVRTNIPSISGNVRRKNWKFRVVNAQGVKLDYLCPDEIKIGSTVRDAMRKLDEVKPEDIKRVQEQIGGIEIFEERTY